MLRNCMAALAAVALVAPVFVSCGNDKDDDDDKPGIADNVTGTYKGTLGAIVTGIDCPMDGEYEVRIIREDDDDVQVVLPECSFTMPGVPARQTIPSVTVTDVDVKGSGNVYTLHEDNYSVMVNGAEYKGRLDGTVSGKEVKLTYSMQPGRMPMQINFSFNGKL